MSNPSLPPSSSGPSSSSRRFSYASVVQGTPGNAGQQYNQQGRATANPSINAGGSYPPAHTSTPHSRHQSRRETMDPSIMPIGLANSLGRLGTLPSYSTSGQWAAGLTASLEEPKTPHFFIPSYLKGTRQARRLEEQHSARLAAQRDARSAHSSNAASLSTSSSSLNLHKMVPSHRGMTHDIIERASPVTTEEVVSPLPSRWSITHEVTGMDLSHGGLDARFSGLSKQNDDAAVVRGDHTIPRECGVFYFEVTVGTKQKESLVQISIGISSSKTTTRRMPGWEPDSWGYTSDDGCLLSGNSSSPKKYGDPFGNGDVIGCGVNFNKGTLFFTRNGNLLPTAAQHIKSDRLYPAVGLKRSGDHVRANFGQSQFVFDIDSLVAQERNEIKHNINNTSIESLMLNLTEPQLIHKLIAQYLAHDGYIETARAFAAEVSQESQSLVAGTSDAISSQDLEPEEDHDAIHRQKIRSAILDGDIDRALKYTNVYYPDVQRENENIYFRLRCRKFIEMIRRCVEMSDGDASPALPATSKHADDYNGVFDHQMELDDSTHLRQAHNGSAWDDGAMDTSTDDAQSLKQPQTYSDMIQKTLEYGQELKEEFDKDLRREIKKALEETLALIGYEDPRVSPLKHLLDESGRVPVAEELNRAILVSLGKSSSSAVERLFAQTDVLLDVLGKDGGPGALIDLRSSMQKPSHTLL